MAHRPQLALRTLIVAALGCSTTVAVAATIAAPTVVVAAAPADGSVTDQIIVSVASPDQRLSPTDIREAAGRGAEEEREFGPRAQIVKLPNAMSGSELEAVMSSLAEQPGVIAVEPDRLLSNDTNDTNFAQQWYLAGANTTSIGVNAEAAWAITMGSPSVKIAVVDGGYVDHADLNGQLLPGYDFTSDSMVANDGDGRDADAHDPGDWVTASETTVGSVFEGCQVRNSSWHGTHVTGVIGAAANNGTGIAGISPGAKVVPIRALGKCGGYTSDILDGMRWGAGLPVAGAPQNPNPARVISLSLGGVGACTPSWQAAINALTASGVVIVVAAGNSNADVVNYEPANCAGVVTVAATGKAGNRAFYSNFGAGIEVAAPGGDSAADKGDTILSTINAGVTAPIPNGDAYARYQGTSMATPQVSATAALMLSVNPTLTSAQVTQILRQTSTKYPTGSTCSTVCGSGIVNAGAAVAAAKALVTPPVTTTTPVTTTPATTTPATTTPATTTTVPRTTTTTVPRTTTTVPRTTTTVPRTTTTTVPALALPENVTKRSPSNGATNQPRKVRLNWSKASRATQYEVCIDATVNGSCDDAWYSTRRRSVTVGKLARRKNYEWQVRAVNDAGSTDADNGTWFTFTTG